jgi:hypothetical protein
MVPAGIEAGSGPVPSWSRIGSAGAALARVVVLLGELLNGARQAADPMRRSWTGSPALAARRAPGARDPHPGRQHRCDLDAAGKQRLVLAGAVELGQRHRTDLQRERGACAGSVCMGSGWLAPAANYSTGSSSPTNAMPPRCSPSTRTTSTLAVHISHSAKPLPYAPSHNAYWARSARADERRRGRPRRPKATVDLRMGHGHEGQPAPREGCDGGTPDAGGQHDVVGGQRLLGGAHRPHPPAGGLDADDGRVVPETGAISAGALLKGGGDRVVCALGELLFRTFRNASVHSLMPARSATRSSPHTTTSIATPGSACTHQRQSISAPRPRFALDGSSPWTAPTPSTPNGSAAGTGRHTCPSGHGSTSPLHHSQPGKINCLIRLDRYRIAIPVTPRRQNRRD